MGKKKKFIDKKKSATFQLLARDSTDPNYDETPGNDRVFVRVDNNLYLPDTFFDGDNPDSISVNGQNDDDPTSIFADAPDDADDCGDDNHRVLGSSMKYVGGFVGASSAEAQPLPERVRKEILELGFPDDGYNYLLHLREIKNTGGGSYFYRNPKANIDQLPRDVKAYDASRVRVSEVKTDDTNDKSIYSVASRTVGVKLQRVLDPEVAALLDDSDLSRFGSDDEDLEEDFVVRANLPEEGADLDVNNLIEEPSEYVETALDNGAVDKEIEVGNDFAGGNLRVCRPLDEQFDMLELQEYATDDEDGEYGGYEAEEDESLANKLNNVLNDSAMDDLDLGDKYAVPADLLHGSDRPKSKEILESAADVIRRCAEYAEKYENEDDNEDVVIVQESSDDSEQWDCETIISTYSNLDNHPAKIEAPGIARRKKIAETVSGALNATSHVITLRGKEKLPVDFLPHGIKSDVEKAKAVPGLRTEPVKRKQHGQESKEEKKERKAAIKEERREARRLKKEMKGIYRGEAQRAQRVAAIAGPSSIHLL
ncbi:hypothetical protein JCGZ_04512 [Jatropha curcas]|uniref:Protein LTV1 homolog n=1 Tax=Jatropha curcas TaxID=180498 RepID=A0A067KR14_JATCU|nr:protein LTV1 homolog [Jatropha curcas]XP_012071971.1 protein LTV1 homolog [Jatropha curcas]KDP38587.1 hypothetical protein JCGZ_04512 [Jatropha curcas]